MKNCHSRPLLLIVQVANAHQLNSPKATILDTKTLTIKNPKFVDEEISYSITGTALKASLTVGLDLILRDIKQALE